MEFSEDEGGVDEGGRMVFAELGDVGDGEGGVGEDFGEEGLAGGREEGVEEGGGEGGVVGLIWRGG